MDFCNKHEYVSCICCPFVLRIINAKNRETDWMGIVLSRQTKIRLDCSTRRSGGYLFSAEQPRTAGTVLGITQAGGGMAEIRTELGQDAEGRSGSSSPCSAREDSPCTNKYRQRASSLATDATRLRCASVERPCINCLHGLDRESSVGQAGRTVRTMPEILHQENSEAEELLLATIRLCKHRHI